MKGGGKQRAKEERKGRKWPACISYGPSVHSKRVGGTWPRPPMLPRVPKSSAAWT